MRFRKSVGVVAIALAAALSLTACSSSKSGGSASNSPSGSSSEAGGGTLAIGVITDSTGLASSGYTTTEKGVKAYVNAVNDAGGINGNKLSYVLADTTSTPAAALLAAQKLVQTNHVFAILAVSAVFFGAESYLLKQGVPVVGAGVDGPEWQDKSNTNLFDVIGGAKSSTVFTTIGQQMKSLGATSCGTIGYADSPSSTQAATASIKSCQTQGLKNGYQTLVSTGSTDMAPVALAMKSHGVDGIWMGTVPSTGFALAAALRQVGVKPKAFILATGYGGDLLSSSAAVQAGQGFQYQVIGQPIEMGTPATKTYVKNLASAGETSVPTYAEQTSYISMAALAQGLKAAGSKPTRQSFSEALRKVSDFDGDGLLSPEKVNFSDYDPQTSCSWLVTLEGKKFVPVQGSPFCGKKVG